MQDSLLETVRKTYKYKKLSQSIDARRYKWVLICGENAVAQFKTFKDLETAMKAMIERDVALLRAEAVKNAD